MAWGYVDFPPLTAFQAWLTRICSATRRIRSGFFRRWPQRASYCSPPRSRAARRRAAGAIVAAFGGVPFAGLPRLLQLPLHELARAADLGRLCVVVIRIIKRDEPRLWPWFGVLAGIAC